jgi:hypothetical protein
MVGSSKFQEQLNKTEEDTLDIIIEAEEKKKVVKAPTKLKRKLRLEPSSKDNSK